MRLYYAPNTISVTVAVTLEEAGLDYDPVRVDFKTAEQTKPGYLEINPKGRVPALETGGEILTETGALVEYVAATVPGANLVPDAPLEAFRMRETMYYLASTAHINHAHKMRGHRWADREESWADMTAKVPETMTAAAAHIEANCLAGPFVLGDRFSLADPYLLTLAIWMQGDDVKMSDFPKLSAFVSTMMERSSVAAVRAKGILIL